MMRRNKIALRCSCRVLITACLFSVMLLASSPIFGAEPDTVRVEEEWVIEIGLPVPKLSAPQVVMVISPTASTDDKIAVFELNHATFPKFRPGGMQLHLWDGDHLRSVSTAPQLQVLGVAEETIQFTSRMRLDGGNLIVEVRNGKSTSWGTFGGAGQLRCSAASHLKNLNEYRSAVSKKHSRIAFGSHRVKKLMLSEVRYYSKDGLITKETTDQIVHQHQ